MDIRRIKKIIQNLIVYCRHLLIVNVIKLWYMIFIASKCDFLFDILSPLNHGESITTQRVSHATFLFSIIFGDLISIKRQILFEKVYYEDDFL
jgi:hypothetical protein